MNTNNNQIIESNRSLILPLEKGERPLFVTRSILEEMARDIARIGNPYSHKNSWEIGGYIAALEVVTEIFKIRCDSGRRENSKDLLESIQALPLFFTQKQVKKWEIDRVWAAPTFCKYTDVITAYGTLLDSISPSEAYINTDANTNHIWEQWFKLTPKEEILETLQYSKNKWKNWEKSRPNQDMHIFNNIKIIGEKINLSSEQISSWTVYELMINHNGLEKIWNESLKEIDYKDLFNIWCKAFDLPKDSIIQLFYEDSSLVLSSIYGRIDEIENDRSHIDIKKIQGHLAMFPKLNNLLTKTINNKNDLLYCFAKPFGFKSEDEILTLDKWNYKKEEIEKINKAINNSPASILIYGMKGSGKSSLVKSILYTLKKQGCAINIHDLQQKIKTNIKELIPELNVAYKIISDEENTLIFDNIPELLNNDISLLTKFSEHRKSAQIWILEDITSINQQILSSFDMVLNLNEMPFKHKLEIAKQYFENEDLAFRISQSVNTPKEIIDIATWCERSEEYSWKNVFHYISTTNRVLSDANKKEPLLQLVELEENIPNFAGYNDVNELLNKLSDYFNHPHIYKEIGAKIPKGILLMGAPGTGKTHFAKHLMKNVGVPMFIVETSKLIKDSNNISLVFNEARKNAPCILFMDEIDVLINSPEEMQGLNLEKQKVLNSFLTQLDGFNSSDGILVIGATHRKIKPDPAAIRSGRLGESIYLSLPNSQYRKEIWKAHLNLKPIASDINYDVLSHASSSFSPADIAEAVNKGAIISAQNRQKEISLECLLKACDDLFWGSSDSSMVLQEEERYNTAIHEAGHALIAWKNGFNVKRITIRPRANALGAVNWENSEGIFTFNKNNMVGRIEMALAGIASEKVMFNEYTNGGSGDLQFARHILRKMLLESGFGKEFNMSYSNMNDAGIWSERRKESLENEEKQILNDAMDNCTTWLESNKDLIEQFAQYLLEEKEISGNKLIFWEEAVKNVSNNIMMKNGQASEDVRVIHRD